MKLCLVTCYYSNLQNKFLHALAPKCLLKARNKYLIAKHDSSLHNILANGTHFSVALGSSINVVSLMDPDG